MAQILRKIPEVVSIQTYAGTAKPFDFNGLVRHSYLRQRSSEGEMQIQLADKGDRERSSHEISRIKLSTSVIVPDSLNI
jgi:hypothetical protein